MISSPTVARPWRSGATAVAAPHFGLAATGALLLASVAGALYNASLVRFMATELRMNDFGRFYYATRAWLAGADLYAPTVATNVAVTPSVTQAFLNMNPPHFHLLIVPIAWLDPGPALAAWGLLSAGTALAAAAVIVRELRLPVTRRGVLWTVAAIAACSATGMVVVTGQVTFVLLLPITLAWQAARHNRWLAFGLWMGACASVKPFLGVFLLYALVRRRGAVAMIAAGAASVGIGLLVFGRVSYGAWLSALGAVDWTWAPMNGSLAGLLARTLAKNPLFTAVVDAPGLVRVLATGLSAGVVGATIWILARDRSDTAVDRAHVALLLAALVASPLGWFYYVWLTAGPGLALSRTFATRTSLARNICLALALPGLVLPLAVVTLSRDTALGTLTFGSLFGWTTLLLWLAVLFDTRASQPAREAQS